jgi:signal transduction histidine kinase
VRELQEVRKVKIEIVDSGIGITQENFPKMFSPYFTTRPGGTGLGLYFTRRLVEQFNGTVEIARSYPGKGTTVVLIFPLQEE